MVNQYTNETSKEYLERAKQRFLEKVNKKGEEECWGWGGVKNDSGYGFMWFKGGNVGAHRLSIKLFKDEEMPEDRLALHNCHNPSCVNPNHLYIGDHSDNTMDAIEEGNYEYNAKPQKGSDNGYSKLTEDDVKEIKILLKYTDKTQKEIAKSYPVEQNIVSDIKTGRRWSHVELDCKEEESKYEEFKEVFE